MLLRLIKGRYEPPDEASVAKSLLRYGFLPATARRLPPMLLRYDRGEFPELAGCLPRLLFVAWLRDHGLLSDELESPTPHATDALTWRTA